MKPLYSESEYKLAKPKDKLPLQCENCNKKYYALKVNIRNFLNPNRHEKGNCCSDKCRGEYKTKKVKVNCNVCNIEIERHPSQLKLYPISFCSKSCASKYSVAHKTTGNNRSKFEIWLQEQLTILYPNLEIKYNDITEIKAELDIFIPSLNLAFEINGVFHYKPIFGIDKLDKIKSKDKYKLKTCIERNIVLHIIDTSLFKYFKIDRAKKYLDKITSIINQLL